MSFGGQLGWAIVSVIYAIAYGIMGGISGGFIAGFAKFGPWLRGASDYYGPGFLIGFVIHACVILGVQVARMIFSVRRTRKRTLDTNAIQLDVYPYKPPFFLRYGWFDFFIVIVWIPPILVWICTLVLDWCGFYS